MNLAWTRAQANAEAGTPIWSVASMDEQDRFDADLLQSSCCLALIFAGFTSCRDLEGRGVSQHLAPEREKSSSGALGPTG